MLPHSIPKAQFGTVQIPAETLQADRMDSDRNLWVNEAGIWKKVQARSGVVDSFIAFLLFSAFVNPLHFCGERVVKVGPFFWVMGHNFLHFGQIVDLVIHMTNIDPCDLQRHVTSPLS